MKSNLIIISTLISTLFLGCKSSVNHKNFIFPNHLKKINVGNGMSYFDFKNPYHCAKIVIFINTYCNSCYSNIWLWKNLVDKYNEFQKIPIAIVLIGRKDIPYRMLKNEDLTKISFFQDEKGEILKLNHITPEQYTSAFLLKKGNEIIIPGNPIYSIKLTNDYIFAIKKLTSHEN